MSEILGYVEVAVFVFGLYVMGIGLCGAFTRSPPRLVSPRTRFAVLIPAHNEARVLGQLIKSLDHQEYPRHLYDIIVIADNCRDDTARVALETGANRVLNRRHDTLKGKGHALHYAFRELGFVGEGDCPYDAAAVFDADNLVDPGYLGAMNSRLGAGETVIQSFVDSKNPDDSWVAAATSVMFWLNNRFILQARDNLGLAAALSGTGMCISTRVLKEVGWSTQTLTEDLEYSMKALDHGYRTTVAAETRTYDEKPLTFYASCRQRLRWARGQVDVAVRYVPRLVARGLSELSPVPLESALRLCQLFFLVAGASVTLVGLLSPGTLRVGRVIWEAASQVGPMAFLIPLVPYLAPLLVLTVDSPPLRPFRFAPLFPLYGYSWIVLIILGMLTFRHKAWMPTRHVRDLTPDSVLKDGGKQERPRESPGAARHDPGGASIFAGQR